MILTPITLSCSISQFPWCWLSLREAGGFLQHGRGTWAVPRRSVATMDVTLTIVDLDRIYVHRSHHLYDISSTCWNINTAVSTYHWLLC
jgi:hypothetical protein